MSELTTVEINGVKMDVDLRTAKRVDTMKVGTRVKVLTRSYDSSPWEVTLKPPAVKKQTQLGQH